MKTSITVILFLLLTISSISSPRGTDETKKEIVQGTVISGKDRKPVAKALVYIVEGEEESQTEANGGFSIETFQKFPLLVTVEHPNYKKTKVKVAAPTRKLVIAVQPNE